MTNQNTNQNERAPGAALNDAREGVAERLDASAADVALAAVDELAEKSAQIEEIQAEMTGLQDQLKRTVAEFANYRRRTEQEKSNLIQYGQALVVQQLLDIVDDFRRSQEAAEELEAQDEIEKAYQSLKQGLDMIYAKLSDQLNRLGVEPIEAVGKPFDEDEHEAMMQQPAPEGTPPGIVLDEVQKGYRMGDRVLRHTKVIVSA